jgi:RNA polymerase sigma factor (sigma-70 family)
LIQEIHAGSARAELALWERYRPRIWFFLLRRLDGDREAARDLEQEVFVALLQAIRDGRLTQSGNPGAYLYKTSSNLATRWMRRVRRNTPVGDADLTRTDDTPETIHLTQEAHETLRRMVGAIAALDRRILDLRFGEEWSYRRIAGELGLSEDSVRQRACRTVAGLRRGLNDR